MIESYAQIETNEMPILSAQQVTGGCMGSIPQLAFTYIQLFGHVTEDEWPYTAGNGNTGTASMITMECHQVLDLLDTPFWTPTTRMLSCNILLRSDHLLLQFMPVDGDPTAAVSTTD